MFAIIGAMIEEIDALLIYFDNMESFLLHGKTIYKNDDLIIAVSGVGKVEAAYTTTLLLDNFPIKFVINIGSAGGLKDNQSVGDIVVANRLSYYDFILDFKADHLGGLRHRYLPSPRDIHLASDILNTLGIKYHIGWGVSGDQFISTKEQTQFITENFEDALFCDMESTAIAHVCTLRNIDFISIRGLSDIAINDGNEIAFEKYLSQAAQISAKVCYEILKMKGYSNEKKN